MMKLVTTEVAVITLVWVEWSMCSMSSIRVNLKFNTTTKYEFEWISVKGIQENIKKCEFSPISPYLESFFRSTRAYFRFH